MRFAAREAKNLDAQNQKGLVPAPSRTIYMARNIIRAAENMMDIFPAPFFLMEKLSFLLMMSSPRKILMNVLRQSATGMRAAAFMPMRPSESQSTDSPVANAMNMQREVPIDRGMHITIAGRIVSIRYGPRYV